MVLAKRIRKINAPFFQLQGKSDNSQLLTDDQLYLFLSLLAMPPPS